MEKITWRGTPGVGDFMWALNCAHRYSFRKQIKVNLEFHWEHDEDYLHHFEEEETIIDRLNYIHNFYHLQDDVKVTHVFNSDEYAESWKWEDDIILDDDGRKRIVAKNLGYKRRFWWESGFYTDEQGGQIPDNFWCFRKPVLPLDRKKVVVWTPQQNAEIPRTWKRLLTENDWDAIISKVRRAGLNTVELTYRTPVREAMYHIATCRQIICYDGMWHYIAKNYAKPMILFSSEGISNYHTRHALKISPIEKGHKTINYHLSDIGNMIGESKHRAIEWERKFHELGR